MGIVIALLPGFLGSVLRTTEIIHITLVMLPCHVQNGTSTTADAGARPFHLGGPGVCLITCSCLIFLAIIASLLPTPTPLRPIQKGTSFYW